MAENIEKVKRYQVIEDNGGGLTLVTFDGNGNVDYFNSGYCGFNSFCGKLYTGDYEPIIDIKTFSLTQVLLMQHGKKALASKHLEALKTFSDLADLKSA